MSSAIKKNGFFVLDFMNVSKETKELVSGEKTEINGILFEIKRFVGNSCVGKEIEVTDKGKHFTFKERVKTYSLEELKNFFSKNNLEIVHLLGDYDLQPFNESTSDRLIMIGKKNQ
jgi:hypothetical protein